MIIEDELDILLLYKDYLANKGYQIIGTSTTANEILKDYESSLPDIVMLDYKLPGNMNGLEAAKMLLQKNKDLSIILVTAFDEVKKDINKDPFFSSKKISVLIKPIRLNLLERHIRNFGNVFQKNKRNK
ncbi:MAG TPA: response regulator [Nitrososphaeraceae archaeon]|nr:response regulator [Nitrososphaeraceae archaeon]